MLKAIKEDDEEALKALIKVGKNLSEPNKEGWLPLHEAAYYGQLRCLKALHGGEAAALGAARGGSRTRGHGPLLPRAACSLPHSLGGGARHGSASAAELTSPGRQRENGLSPPAKTFPNPPNLSGLIPRKALREGWLLGEQLPACSRTFQGLNWCGKTAAMPVLTKTVPHNCETLGKSCLLSEPRFPP